MRRLLPLLLVPVLAGGCATGSSGPADAVDETEAQTAVQRLVELAGAQTAPAMRKLCAPDLCSGLSSSIPFEPALAPDQARAPRQVCTVALPATSTQAGPRLVVLQGERGDGVPYVGQVLLERVDGRVVAHEPGFWLGIRYTALQEGRAWAGQGDLPRARAVHEAAVLRACTDTTAWLSEVAGAQAGRPTQPSTTSRSRARRPASDGRRPGGAPTVGP